MIVISGITSALGIRLALSLAKRGIHVRGFARHIDSVKMVLSHPLIRLEAADLNDKILMQSLCADADVVVHLAALSAPWGRYEDFFKTNVEGTKSIIQAAKHAQLKRFIHISTPSIYFDFRDRFNISEEEVLPHHTVNAYAATKKMAEEVVDLAFHAGLPSITLRPRAIFGPHDKTLFPRVLKACQKGGIPAFKKQSPVIDITYVDNVVHAIWLAINAPKSCLGQKYNISNREPTALKVILELLLSRLSIPLKTKRIPYAVAYMAAWASELKGYLLDKEPLITRYGVGVMTYSQTLCIEKARQELNYQPLISLNEGINRYADWLQTQ